MNIDLELAIKRYFYERNKNYVSIKSFEKFLSNLSDTDLNTFSYLLKIKNTKKGDVYDFNDINYSRFKSTSEMAVYLDDNVCCDLIHYKHSKKRKQSQLQEEEKENNRVIDFIPDSTMELFIENLISNAIRILIRDMNQT